MHELSWIERAPPTSNSIIILDTYFFHSMLASHRQTRSLSDQAVYNFKVAKSVHQHFYAGEIGQSTDFEALKFVKCTVGNRGRGQMHAYVTHVVG